MAAAIPRSFVAESLAQFQTADAEWAKRQLDPRKALATGWVELDDILPDHGFVHGVTELAAPFAHGGGTTLAIAAIAAALQRDAQAWAAWVDPQGTLYAPALAQAGVDLARLLVVRPPANEVRQVAVKLAASAAFSVVVVDHFAALSGRGSQKADELFVRKLSLEPCVSLVLTDQHAPRTGSLPTALRLELSRRPDAITVRVAKDRMGRAGTVKTVPLRTKPSLAVVSASALTPGSSSVVGSVAMRILAITLPRFRLELAKRSGPVVIVRTDEKTRLTERTLVSGTRISEVSEEAASFRIAPGDTLARARAKCSDVDVRIVSDKSVQSALENFAEMLLQFGATVSYSTEPLCTLWVDVTGCTHLHGKGLAGEKRVATLALALLETLGHHAAAAIAEGPLLAQIFARNLKPGSTLVVPKPSTKEMLASLPTHLLPITEEACAFFHHMGLLVLSGLQALPKASLAARLDPKRAPQILGLLEGYDPSPLVPYVPPLIPEERLEFDDDVQDVSALGFVLRPMLEKLALRIEWRGLAVSKLSLTLGLGHGETQVEKLAFPMPLASTSDLFSALRTKLDRVTLEAPVRDVRLAFTELVPRAQKTLSLLSKDEHSEGALAKIVSELSLQLGEGALGCLAPQESWLLEERSKLVKIGTKIRALCTYMPLEPTRLEPRAPFSFVPQNGPAPRFLLRVTQAAWWLPQPPPAHDLLFIWSDDKACVVERVHASRTASHSSKDARFYLRAYAD